LTKEVSSQAPFLPYGGVAFGGFFSRLFL